MLSLPETDNIFATVLPRMTQKLCCAVGATTQNKQNKQNNNNQSWLSVEPFVSKRIYSAAVTDVAPAKFLWQI